MPQNFCPSCRADVHGNRRPLLLEQGTKCHGCGFTLPASEAQPVGPASECAPFVLPAETFKLVNAQESGPAPEYLDEYEALERPEVVKLVERVQNARFKLDRAEAALERKLEKLGVDPLKVHDIVRNCQC